MCSHAEAGEALQAFAAAGGGGDLAADQREVDEILVQARGGENPVEAL